MKASKMKLLMLLIFAPVLVSCGNNPNKNSESTLRPLTPPPSTPQITFTEDWSTPSVTPSGEITATDTPAPTEALPTPTDIPVPTEIPYSDTSCMYLNSSSGFPLAVTESSEVIFSYYDDVVTIHDFSGETASYSLSEIIHIDELNTGDPELWFFCGAFQSDSVVYAHYDYLNNQAQVPSLLISIDTETKNIECIIQSANPKKRFSDSFIVLENQIYYTKTRYSSYGTATTDIFVTGPSGENSTILLEGILGNQISFMSSNGIDLYYIVTDINSVNTLFVYQPLSGQTLQLYDNLPLPEFFAVWKDNVLFSVQDNILRGYCGIDGELFAIHVCDTATATIGHPMTDGSALYVPCYGYDSNAATILLPIDLQTRSAGDPIEISSQFYYITGMIDQYVYAEDVDNFKIFEITD